MATHEADIISIISTLASLTFTQFPIKGDLFLKPERKKASSDGIYMSEFFTLHLENTSDSTLQTNVNSVMAISSRNVGGFNGSNPAGKFCYWIHVYPTGRPWLQWGKWFVDLELEARYVL